MMKYSNHIIIT